MDPNRTPLWKLTLPEIEHELGRDLIADIDRALAEVREELLRASARFGRFNSLHEGFAVMDEERDELWDEVKGKSDGPQDQRKVRARWEATQVAAMATRIMVDVLTEEHRQVVQ